jgi:hypothetical protein
MIKDPEFPDYEVGPVISEPTLAGSSGAPIEASRKGKAPPSERGRGKVFLACEPDRVTAEAFRRRNNGSHLQHLNSDVKSTGPRKLIRIFQETLVRDEFLVNIGDEK